MTDQNDTSANDETGLEPDGTAETEPEATSETKATRGTTSSASDVGSDLVARLKQLTAPLVESLDNRLGGQIDRRVDERVEALLRDRLAVIERAIADLDRAVRELQTPPD